MLAAQTTAEGSPPQEKKSPLASETPEHIQQFLKDVSVRLNAQVDDFEPEIAGYARYALTAQGKQLRPLLVALSAEAAGKLNDEHVTVAAIIEMVHLATLVHDDVIDQAEIRRNRPTLAANWGNEISVLLGDCLFAQSVKMAASYPTPQICRAVSSATAIVCSGEILQTQHEGNLGLSRAEYFRLVSMKTAELFALSCELGAILAGANETEQKALRQFGIALGTAYQIYDDCVDLFGSEARAGKSLGTDLQKGKLTLPILVTLERANDFDRTQLHEMLQGWRPDFLPRVLELAEKCNAFEETTNVIVHYLSRAREHLHALPLSPGRVALNEMTEYLGRQTAALEVV